MVIIILEEGSTEAEEIGEKRMKSFYPPTSLGLD
jgi:hypothetical protein